MYRTSAAHLSDRHTTATFILGQQQHHLVVLSVAAAMVLLVAYVWVYYRSDTNESSEGEAGAMKRAPSNTNDSFFSLGGVLPIAALTPHTAWVSTREEKSSRSIVWQLMEWNRPAGCVGAEM